METFGYFVYLHLTTIVFYHLLLRLSSFIFTLKSSDSKKAHKTTPLKGFYFVFFPHARISWFFYITIKSNKSQQNMCGLYKNPYW